MSTNNTTTCTTCLGTGDIIKEIDGVEFKKPCTECNGKGVLPTVNEFEKI